MAKQTVKQAVKQKKPARHHLFLITVIVIIILLAVTAYVLQRNTNLETIAGEAIRQRIDETKQLALSAEEAKIITAFQQGDKEKLIGCPPALQPATEQHWKLSEDWKWWPLKAIDVQCEGSRILCYYADSETEINRADQIVTYFDNPLVKSCKKAKSGLGCDCEIVPPPGQPGKVPGQAPGQQ